MTAIYSNTRYGVCVLTYKSTGQQQTQAGSYLESRDFIDRPLTAKRPKPTDLFAGATARTVKGGSESYTTGSTDSNPKDSNLGYYTRAPGSYWMTVGVVLTVPDMNRVDGALRAKIKDSNLNLAQSLAEYKQTSSMLSGAVKDLVGIFRNVRSGRAGKALYRALTRPPNEQSKRVANRWLELQYGIRPLMSDVFGSAEALQKALVEGRYQYVRVKFTEKHRRTTTTSAFITTERLTTTLNGKARYKISSAAVKQLSEIGITNPALLAWELVPYSFVVDWFFNVGNWLSSLDALAGVSDLTIQKGYYLEGETSYQGILGWGKFYTAPTGMAKETKSERFTSGKSLAMPRLMYKPSLSLTKVLNAMALLRQLR